MRIILIWRRQIIAYNLWPGQAFFISLFFVGLLFWGLFWGFLVYNSGMDKLKLQQILTRNTAMVWGALCELRPSLVRYNEPKIMLNSRLWRTAGRCFQDTNTIEMGYKFFAHSREYYATMLNVILPHEIIHQADFVLYGLSEKNCGHGVQWQKLMVEYGLPADKYHYMEITRK